MAANTPLDLSIKPYLARYSPIAPIAILEHLHRHEILGDYLLILAHDVIAHPQRYIKLITDVREQGPDTFIIMDNSAVELGAPITFNSPEFRGVCDQLKPDCVVAPDIIGSKEGTLAGLMHMLRTCDMPEIPLMCIPQGSNVAEWIQCAEVMQEVMKERQKQLLWGVPRWAANQWGSRGPLVQYLNMASRMQGTCVPRIHLMGMSHSFADDIRCTSMPNVMGIDSANPVVLGHQFIDLAEIMYEENFRHVDRGDFWEAKMLTPHMNLNIRFVRQKIREIHPGRQPHEGLMEGHTNDAK